MPAFFNLSKIVLPTMQKRLLLILCFLLWQPLFSHAAGDPRPAVVAKSDQLLGESIYNWAWVQLYTARLWAPSRVTSMEQLWQTPFALSLTYDINILPEKLASVSLDKMQEQEAIPKETAAQWQQQLAKLFPEITKGTTLIGLYNPKGSMQLYRDGQLLGEITEAQFAQRFFEIWLHPRTTYPKNRLELLGWKAEG
jgi:hypothetical protein